MKNFQSISAPRTSAKLRKNNKKGRVTIVYKQNSSRCVLIDTELVETLGLKDIVKIAFAKKEKKLLLGSKIPGIKHEGYILRNRNAKERCIKKVIYSTQLVKEIIDVLQLDFAEKTSDTLYDLELINEEDNIIAVVGKGNRYGN